MKDALKRIVIICGPTCVGKTGVAVRLAQEFGGEIVSADSQQVYKELNIGTAKPTAEEQGAVRHHLIDIITPNEQFDVSRFVEMADAAIKDIVARGKVPFVVGGTGLYIKALCSGLMDAPPRDENYRAELEKLNIEHLYLELFKKDPKTARRLKPNDRSRIIRALEVYHSSGRSISDIQEEHNFKEGRYDALKIGLNIERSALYRRIDERVDKMMAAGLEEEVATLAKKYGADAPALKAVGYKEIVKFGVRSSEFGDEIKKNTRHYAKRQLTWFRADKETKWFDPSHVQEIKKVVAKFVGR